MSVRDIADFAIKHFGSEGDRSGKVLYSRADTLKPGAIYLLGINPGGDPVKYQAETIRSDLEQLPARTINSYLDEIWETGPAGGRPIQRRVHWLLTEIGLDTRSVAASNLLFQRTRSEADLGRNFERFAQLCWPVHRRIIDVVEPQMVLIYGGSPYRYLKKKFTPTSESTLPSGHGDWACRSFEVQGRYRVVALPHLARYDVIGKRDVVEWLARFLRYQR